MSQIAINQNFNPLNAKIYRPEHKLPRATHKLLWAILDRNNNRITGVYTHEKYAQTAYQKLDYPMAYQIVSIRANTQF